MILVNMTDRVAQMKEIHADAIDRDFVNCNFDTTIDWNNPIKSLRIISGSLIGSVVRINVPQCIPIDFFAPRSKAASSASSGFM